MPNALQDDVTLAVVPMLAEAAPPPGGSVFDGPRHEDAFGGESGIRRGPSFTPAEVKRIEALVKERLLYAAAGYSQAAADALEATPLERYHDVSVQFDHSKMLSKLGRILSGDAVAEIKQMSFFDYVRDVFGDFYLADEDGVGHEQICIRVVRPNQREDVGSLHRDDWFWSYYNWPVPSGENRTKVWTGICVDAPLNGLMLAPGSHQRPYGYRMVQQEKKIAFEPEFDWRDIGLRRFEGLAGDPVMFNYKTLHVGSVNRAPTCRVSIETTIMYR
jgi:hypothetical protein